jgi:SAM-dependent methyltransferase
MFENRESSGVTSAFGTKYSKYYDLIYCDKDYESEVDYLEKIFKKHSEKRIHDVIDISCGTGGHAILLAKRGYSVTALDASSHMLEIAREKKVKARIMPRFLLANMNDFRLEQTFDACISMFDSIDYLGSLEEVEATFINVRKHLRPDSLFIFQFWNGIAVIAQRPAERMRVVESRELRLIRYARPLLRVAEQKCEVNYHTIVLRGREVVDEFEERHVMLFLYPKEVELSLKRCGFRPVGIHPFRKLDGEVGEEDWSVIAIAKRE